MSESIGDTWPPELALRIDAACRRFEARLATGEHPHADEYLDGFDGAEREALQAELLAVLIQWLARNETVDLPGTARDAASGVPVPAPPRYQIESVLGEGGMDVVYKARDTHLNRTVALKMIRDAHAGPRHLARFRAEAEAVAALVHQNVVQISTPASTRATRTRAEFVAGGTSPTALADRSRARRGTTHRNARPRPSHRTSEASSTATSSRQRIVHAPNAEGLPAGGRPSCGVPKVTDFGLVKRLDDSAGAGRRRRWARPRTCRPSKPAVTPGTLARPPTYALARSSTSASRVGPLPAATVAETVRQVLHDDPVRPRLLCADMPDDLEAVCLKCLESADHCYPTPRRWRTTSTTTCAGDPPTVRLGVAAARSRPVHEERHSGAGGAAGRPQNAGPYSTRVRPSAGGSGTASAGRDRPLTSANTPTSCTG